jgi:hypothetical protein
MPGDECGKDRAGAVCRLNDELDELGVRLFLRFPDEQMPITEILDEGRRLRREQFKNRAMCRSRKSSQFARRQLF